MSACLLALALLPLATQAQLVDHYEFENSGDDSAGPPFADGTVGANVTFTTGIFGQAASFPGTTSGNADRIVVPQADAFDPGSGDFTVAFFTQRNNPNANVFNGAFDALNGTGTGYQGFFLDNAANNAFRLRVDDDAGNFVLLDTSAAFDDTDFHHVALVVDRTADEALFYVDGMPETPLNIAALTGAISPDQPLWIGNSNTLSIDGSLDDLRFFNAALSADEISALIAVPEPSSLLLWGCVAAIGLLLTRRTICRRVD